MKVSIVRTAVFVLVLSAGIPLQAQEEGGIADSLIEFEDSNLPGNKGALVKPMLSEKPAGSDQPAVVKKEIKSAGPQSEDSDDSWFSDMVASDQTVVNLIILTGLGLLFILFRIKNRNTRRSYM